MFNNNMIVYIARFQTNSVVRLLVLGAFWETIVVLVNIAQKINFQTIINNLVKKLQNKLFKVITPIM